ETVLNGHRRPEHIQDAAGKALAERGQAIPPGSADGAVAEDRAVGEGHGRSGPLVVEGAAVAGAAGAAAGQRADEGRVLDRRGRGDFVAEARVVLDGAADPEVRPGGTDGLVGQERAVAHREPRAPEVVDGAAHAPAEERGAGAAQGLVAAEGTEGD